MCLIENRVIRQTQNVPDSERSFAG